MRIRKQLPLPPPDLQSSTLHSPPYTLSPPPLHHHSHVLLPPSVLPNQTATDETDRLRSDLHLAVVSKMDPPVLIVEEEKDLAEEKHPTNQRKGYNQGAETSAADISISSSPSHEGHWCEEDKVFPLKKRRASFISKMRERMIMEKEQIKENSTVRESMKTNKTWVEDYADKYEEEEEDGEKRRDISGIRKMKASRCGRKSGRGWRCPRPSLQGYSMCEHHLTQSRLHRSVHPRKGSPNAQSKKAYTSLYFKDKDSDHNHTGDGEKGFKKRKRIGILKARSMRSLLGQNLPPPATPATAVML